MRSIIHAHLTFHLRGPHAESPLMPAAESGLRPALLARYADLSSLRYDFPLVLAADGTIQSLSGVFDRMLADIAPGDDHDRVIRQSLRLEQRIREIVAGGAQGTLSQLCRATAIGATSDADAAMNDTVARVRDALCCDGEVIDCRLETAGRVITHLWRGVQRAKAAELHRELDVLTHRLSDILDAEAAASPASRSADRLRASFGPRDGETIDFHAMSRVLRPIAAPGVLSAERRERLESTRRVLQTQRFLPRLGEEGYDFAFTSCTAALAAYWARRAELADVIRALAVARLEIAGALTDEARDVVSAAVDRAPIDPLLRAMLPDYLISVDAGTFDPDEQAALLEMFSAGLPMKVLLRSDDVLDASIFDASHFGFGFTGRQLVSAVIGLRDAFVLQTPASHLLANADALRRGLAFSGPALFSVFSGANGHTGDLPPYLVAAAALESRAFPAIAFDPTAGGSAGGLSISGNPEPGADWPAHQLSYETATHQAATVDLPFTFVDFVLCDERFAAHFARADRSASLAQLMTVADALAARSAERTWEGVPSVTAVDRRNRLTRLVVDDPMVQQARRCRDLWRGLQDISVRRQPVDAAPPDAPERERVAEAPQAAEGPSAPASVPASSDDPFIETPRCSTCNECVQINNRMFGYNENRQAFIADVTAGTYRQLVEAAESCQVSIIHPGKPRDLAESGLEELLQRAAAFL